MFILNLAGKLDAGRRASNSKQLATSSTEADLGADHA